MLCINCRLPIVAISEVNLNNFVSFLIRRVIGLSLILFPVLGVELVGPARFSTLTLVRAILLQAAARRYNGNYFQI